MINKILISIALFLGISSCLWAQASIRGINLVSPVYAPDISGMHDVAATNTNWIAICPWAFMVPGDPSVYYNTTDNYWGDRPENMYKIIEDARLHDFNILLKPHFWVNGYGWPGDYQLSEMGWYFWENNYTAFVIQQAQFAEENKIEMYCIGVEFKTAVQQRPEFWTRLISEVRKVYSGKLLYAANWDNYQNVNFWDQLDYIGIDAYFPLTKEATPTRLQLKKKWKRQGKLLEEFANDIGKQIIFTEYGYRSTDFTAWRQWEIEQISPEIKINLQAQQNAYAALYESIWEAEWFAGGFIWKWYPDLTDAGGTQHSGYTPQNKPVMEIIKTWYAK